MLRHVCASWLGQMQGVEALTIRDLLGHSSVTMTDRYMHGDQADLHDAIHKLGNFGTILGAVSAELKMKPALATRESRINTGVKWWTRLGLNQ